MRIYLVLKGIIFFHYAELGKLVAVWDCMLVRFLSRINLSNVSLWKFPGHIKKKLFGCVYRGG